MKKRVWIIVICLLLVGVFISTTSIELVGADSGFDSSYDSGGSWDSGSDYGGSSSSGDGGDLFFLIYLCFEYPPLGIAVLTVIIIIYLSNKKKAKQILEKALKENKLGLLDVNIFPEEKRPEIEAFNLYKQIQYAWMNFDEETLRKCTTDEMYNMYLMQLDTLKVKNQKNIMYDIKYLNSSIKERYEENGQETIVMNMNVSCYDFIIDTKTNKVVRGSASKLHIYSYELTFVRTKEIKDTDICPQCGAPVEGNNSGVCEYCRSTLISNSYTLVMSKKKMISQK
ncbi:MAG: TIM44-like domain-containing protein [Bacilli bacterium]|nr:TIM44-like domain-containing protein [Bacilli bacterium]